MLDESWYYWKYISELIAYLQEQNTQHELVIYTKNNLKYNRYSLFDDIKTKKVFEKENFALMIFFDHHIPHGYKGDFIVMIEDLKEVFFPKKKWLHRKIYSYKLKAAIARAKKVLVLDGGSAMELNENLNVPEDKIEKVPAFFPKYIMPQDSGLAVDVKAQNNIRGNYLIYDSGNEVHNNFERILKTLHKLKEKGSIIYLVILCDETNRDLDIRSKVIELDIAWQILFLGNISPEHEQVYYKQSSWVIFSSIYESFPFNFSKALAYNCSIFANDIPSVRQVMGETISYLDPLSIHNMCDTIAENVPKNSSDYSTIFETFSIENSALELIKVIEAKD